MDPRTARLILRPKALHEKARDLFARFQPRVPFGLTVVELPRLRARLVRDSEITWRHLAATASVPPILRPVRIQGNFFLDGGLAGALPLWAAEEMGATRAIAVNALTTPLFRLLRKALPARRPSAALEVIPIEPSTRLGSVWDAVRWSPANVERWIEQGERDANRAATSITM
jgi:NTE family protein